MRREYVNNTVPHHVPMSTIFFMLENTSISFSMSVRFFVVVIRTGRGNYHIYLLINLICHVCVYVEGLISNCLVKEDFKTTG